MKPFRHRLDNLWTAWLQRVSARKECLEQRVAVLLPELGRYKFHLSAARIRKQPGEIESLPSVPEPLAAKQGLRVF